MKRSLDRKWQSPKSIKTKFLFIGFILLFTIFFIYGLINLNQSIKTTQEEITRGAVSYAELSAKSFAETYDLYFDSGYLKFQELSQDMLSLNSAITQVQIIDINGVIKFDSKYLNDKGYYGSDKEEKVTQSVVDNVIKPEATYAYVDKTNRQLTEIVYPYFTDWQSHPYSIRYLVSYDQVNQMVNQALIQALILIILLTIFSSLLLSTATNRSILNPLKSVIKLTESISAGDYGKRLEVKTNDEIQDLANSVNHMAETLAQNIKDLEELDKLKDEFVDIAAHNLKIPLNHLKFDLEYLIKRPKIDEKSMEILKDININYHKLEFLSEDLVNVTSIKKGSLQNSIFLPLDLVGVIKEAVEEMKSACETKEIKLSLNLPHEAEVLGDAMKLKQVFLIILDNAIRYNKKGGAVCISLKQKYSTYLIEITDTGYGISKDEIPKLFQKFYRAPSSATYVPDGVGLGLYLSKLIVEVHHGDISVESETGKGTTFAITMLTKNAFKQKYPFK